ncbi:MAG: isocitrate lyase/PEP mutase family protein [Armatimonadetes bacterium]|nr:isocitrate lyase/PEP mutase family protein [Armatimonadota bacterium]
MDPHTLRVELRRRITSGGVVMAPGAFDAFSARLVEEAGFPAVYASGGAIARSSGLPDLGLLSLEELVARIAQMTAAVRLPVIADGETGFGNALNAARTVRLYEDAGVAAMHLEDQVFPKRCGHYDGQEIIPLEEMVGKVRAAVEARRDPDLVLIARTDARSAAGLDEAIRRARAYAKAKADVIFVEAPRSIDEVKAIAAAVSAPLLYNLTYSGKSPVLPPEDLHALGYRIVIYPADLQLASLLAMRRALKALQEQGLTPPPLLAPFEERDAVVRLDEYLAMSARYGGTD